MDDLRKRKLDVYCTFRNNGLFYPLKVRLFDEDGVRQEYVIHKYKLIDGAGNEHISSRDMLLRPVITFDCSIDVFGRERVIRLLFSASDMKWTLIGIR